MRPPWNVRCSSLGFPCLLEASKTKVFSAAWPRPRLLLRWLAAVTAAKGAGDVTGAWKKHRRRRRTRGRKWRDFLRDKMPTLYAASPCHRHRFSLPHHPTHPGTAARPVEPRSRNGWLWRRRFGFQRSNGSLNSEEVRPHALSSSEPNSPHPRYKTSRIGLDFPDHSRYDDIQSASGALSSSSKPVLLRCRSLCLSNCNCVANGEYERTRLRRSVPCGKSVSGYHMPAETAEPRSSPLTIVGDSVRKRAL